jgi:hypothetical protein
LCDILSKCFIFSLTKWEAIEIQQRLLLTLHEPTRGRLLFRYIADFPPDVWPSTRQISNMMRFGGERYLCEGVGRIERKIFRTEFFSFREMTDRECDLDAPLQDTRSLYLCSRHYQHSTFVLEVLDTPVIHPGRRRRGRIVQLR